MLKYVVPLATVALLATADQVSAQPRPQFVKPTVPYKPNFPPKPVFVPPKPIFVPPVVVTKPYWYFPPGVVRQPSVFFPPVFPPKPVFGYPYGYPYYSGFPSFFFPWVG